MSNSNAQGVPRVVGSKVALCGGGPSAAAQAANVCEVPAVEGCRCVGVGKIQHVRL